MSLFSPGPSVSPGLASFLWFVGFCFLANQWQATSPDELPLAQGSDAARATITFCFFSILTWVCMCAPAGPKPALFLRAFTCELRLRVCLFQGYQYVPVMSTLKNISFMEDKQRLLHRAPAASL